ncbi:DinB family protein [Robiginitalea sp.]|uniref:DinB family protein n=1 Tax=Robiginitalea sp. TaxID=1902411 RepID=UPI003C742C3E
MKAFFQQVFDYNYHSNKQLITAFAELELVPEKSVELFNHILNAHHLWNARIMEQHSEFGIWQVHEPRVWEEIHYDNQRNSFEIITNTDFWERRIKYEDSEGMSFTRSLQDILFHIINHSTHHRGQILMDFRANGIDPPQQDYIFYKH